VNKKVILSIGKKETFRIEKRIFRAIIFISLYRRIKFIYTIRENKKIISYIRDKEKEHSNSLKDCSDLSGLLRKFLQFLFASIKRGVIYYILY
jgi:hypothetical protein